MWKYLVAVLLLAHGIGHIMPFLAAWTPKMNPGFSGGSRLFSGDMPVSSPADLAFGLLGFVAVLGFVGSALGLLLHQEWWPQMTIAAAIVSLVTILPWASVWPTGSMIGAVLDQPPTAVPLPPPPERTPTPVG
jgi:hypothetical protein